MNIFTPFFKKNITETPVPPASPAPTSPPPRKKIIKKIFIIFFAILIIVALRINIVLNSDTYLPITNATVQYEHFNFATGCGDPVSFKTILGIAIPLRATAFTYWGLCMVKVSAPGYHPNGDNHIGNHYFLPRITLLKPQVSNDTPIEFWRVFAEGKGMDVISYLAKNSNTKAPLPENDFTFSGLQSTLYTDANGTKYMNGTRGVAIMSFSGNGGVQVISDSVPMKMSGEYYYDLENLRTAPEDGYQQELAIVPGKAYVARLRDGQHYMKFHMFATNNEEKGDSVCLVVYANPSATPSMDFLNVGTSKFCSFDRDPASYTSLTTKEKITRDLNKSFSPQKYIFKNTVFDDKNYSYNIEWNSPGADSTKITPSTVFTIELPPQKEIDGLIASAINTNVVTIPVKLRSETMVFKAKVGVPMGNEVRSPSFENVHSVKEICDIYFKSSDITIPSVKYNYDECVQYSFGFN